MQQNDVGVGGRRHRRAEYPYNQAAVLSIGGTRVMCLVDPPMAATVKALQDGEHPTWPCSSSIIRERADGAFQET